MATSSRASEESERSDARTPYGARALADYERGDLIAHAIGVEQPRTGSYAISTIVNLPQGRSSFANISSTLGSSIPPSLKPPQLSSLVTTSGQNTVLAPSHKRAAPPPLQLSDPPKVAKGQIESYVNEIKASWKKWDRNVALAREEQDSLNSASEGASSSQLPGLDAKASGSGLAGRPRSSLPSLSSIPSVFFDPSFSLANPATFDVVTERIAVGRSPTRSTTSPSAPAFSQGQLSIPDLASDQILQEKLSHYLDVVELHLVSEISQRSSSFFSALGNLQALHAQSAACLAQVTALEKELREADSQVAKKGLHLVRLGLRRRNLKRVEGSLRRVQDICTAVAEAEELVQAGEWETALTLISDLEALWTVTDNEASLTEASRTQPTPQATPAPLAVRKIKAFSALPERLHALRTIIGRSLETELIGILLHELRGAVKGYAEVNGKGWKRREDGQPTDDEVEGAERNAVARVLDERIRPLVRSLVRASGLQKLVTAWREGVLKEVRSLVRERLPVAGGAASADDDEGLALGAPPASATSAAAPSMSEKTTALTRNLRALSHAAFLGIATQTYTDLLGCIEVVDMHAKVIAKVAREESALAHPKPASQQGPGSPQLTVVPSLDDPHPPDVVRPPQAGVRMPGVERPLPDLPEVDTFESDLGDVVHATAELANTRFSKVLNVRSEVHATLELPDFVSIFDVTWTFIVACEVTSRRMIVGLRGVMVGQAKAFLQAFHQKRVSDGAKLVEEEQWGQVEVPADIQSAVDQIVASAVEDPREFVLTATSLSPASSPRPIANGSNRPSKQLDIEGTTFYAVPAVLKTLTTLSDYLRVVVNCTLLTTDAMVKIVEFLKAFNSRTCQVVLGAGAMRSAGLKNITAKHLALASQAVSIMINLIPYVRECLRRHLSPKQAVMLIDFDKLKRDFQEHQNEIHAKLVGIMGDRLVVHVKALHSVEWEHPTPHKKGGANPYAENLTKEVATLHKVLSRYLQASTLEVIMMQVFSTINSRLAEEYGSIQLHSENAKLRLLEDARFVKARLLELKGFERQPPGADLDILVESKPVPKRRVSALASPSVPATALASGSPEPTPPAEVVLAAAATPAQQDHGPTVDQGLDASRTRDEASTEDGGLAPSTPLPEERSLDGSEEPLPAVTATPDAASNLPRGEVTPGIDANGQLFLGDLPDPSPRILETPSPNPGELVIATGLSAPESGPEALSADSPRLSTEPIGLTNGVEASSPTVSQPVETPAAPAPAKLSLAQRLAALANARKESIPPSFRTLGIPAPLQRSQSEAGVPRASVQQPPAEKAPEPIATASVEPATVAAIGDVPSPTAYKTPPRQTLKERLAALAAKGQAPTNSTPPAPASQQSVPPESSTLDPGLVKTVPHPEAVETADPAGGRVGAQDLAPEDIPLPPSPPSTFPPDHRLQSPALDLPRTPRSPGPEVSPIIDLPLPPSPSPGSDGGPPGYAVYKRKGTQGTPRSSGDGNQTLSPSMRSHFADSVVARRPSEQGRSEGEAADEEGDFV